MSVLENICFGLKMRKVPWRGVKVRAKEALRVVRLEHRAAQAPARLSGGEQQRIAFARAIVIRPRLLLPDEPFSNLDARLRRTMRTELLELLESLDIATLMATHDQEEAMAVGHRIAVMRAGRIRRIGASRELHQLPKSRFVGEFLGESNLFPVQSLATDGGLARVAIEGMGEIRAAPAVPGTSGRIRHALVRPERIRVLSHPEAAPDGWNRLDGVLEHLLFLGPRIEARLRVDDHAIRIAAESEAEDLAVGQAASIAWPVEATAPGGGDDDE